MLTSPCAGSNFASTFFSLPRHLKKMRRQRKRKPSASQDLACVRAVWSVRGLRIHAEVGRGHTLSLHLENRFGETFCEKTSGLRARWMDGWEKGCALAWMKLCRTPSWREFDSMPSAGSAANFELVGHPSPSFVLGRDASGETRRVCFDLRVLGPIRGRSEPPAVGTPPEPASVTQYSGWPVTLQGITALQTAEDPPHHGNVTAHHQGLDTTPTRS